MSNFVCMTRKSKPFTVQIGLERAINKTKMRAKMNTEGINQKHYPEEVSIKIEKYESENGRMLSVAKGFFLLLRHKRNLGIVVHTSIRIFSMYIVRMYREILITYRHTHTHIHTQIQSHANKHVQFLVLHTAKHVFCFSSALICGTIPTSGAKSSLLQGHGSGAARARGSAHLDEPTRNLFALYLAQQRQRCPHLFELIASRSQYG